MGGIVRPWTNREVRYLADHAGDGVDSIAATLCRSVDSVKAQAHRMGLSLRMRWQCPRCGRMTYHPLNRATGWCSACTKEEHARELREQVREMEEEAMREQKANRERQCLYSRKSSLKKKRNQ